MALNSRNFSGPVKSCHFKFLESYMWKEILQLIIKYVIANKVSTALKFTDNTFFQPVEIDLVNKETNELLSIDKDGSIPQPQKQLNLPENKDSLNTLHFGKVQLMYLIQHIMSYAW